MYRFLTRLVYDVLNICFVNALDEISSTFLEHK